MELYRYLGVVNRQVAILLNVNKKKRNLNKQKFFDFILESGMNLTEASNVSLYKFDEDHFSLLSSQKKDDVDCAFMPVFSKSSCLWLEPIIENYIRVQKVFQNPQESIPCKSIHYLLVLPITDGKKLFGAIFMGFSNKKHLSTQELDFCEAFAYDIAMPVIEVLSQQEENNVQERLGYSEA